MLNDSTLRKILINGCKLSPAEERLFFTIREIYFFWGSEHACYATNDVLVNETNMPIGTVRRALKSLEEKKLISLKYEKTKGFVEKRNIFPLEDEKLAEKYPLKPDHHDQCDQRNDDQYDQRKGFHHDQYDQRTMINMISVEPFHHDQYDHINNHRYILNNQSLNNIHDHVDNSEVETESEIELSDSSHSTGIPDLTSLLANSDAQQILEGSRPLTPQQPAGSPPFPLECDSFSKSVRNHAQKKSNGGEPRSLLGGEEKIDLSERKPIDLELTTNPTNATIQSTWNGIAQQYGLPQVSVMTESRSRKAKAAIKACGGIDKWGEGIRSQLEKSAFHRGENDRGWRATFDYYSRSDKALAALETIGTRSPAKKSSFEDALELLYGNGVEGIEWK